MVIVRPRNSCGGVLYGDSHGEGGVYGDSHGEGGVYGDSQPQE